MKILGIEHIGIAVDDLNKTSSFWGNILNILHTHTEVVESEQVKTTIFDTKKGKVELLESRGSDTPVGKFLSKKGEGIHHVCFEVDDIKQAIIELKENNIRVLSDEPRTGAEGYQVVFIHPSSAGGVLVELAQKPN